MFRQTLCALFHYIFDQSLVGRFPVEGSPAASSGRALSPISTHDGRVTNAIIDHLNTEGERENGNFHFKQ